MNNIEFLIGAKTDIGNVKKINQDAFLCKVGSVNESEFGLFIVCDGVGGLSCGEIASSKVIKIFNDWWHNELKEILNSRYSEEIIQKSILNTMTRANKELINFSKSKNIQAGTTTTVLFIIDNKYYISHIGDSRVYKVDKKMEILTKDHTYYQKLIDEGKFEEAKTVKKSVLVQCIGVKEDIDIYFKEGEINGSCTFLVCSDGFYNRMDEKKVIKTFKAKKINATSMQESCAALVEDIKLSGERDNITLLTIKIDVENSSMLKKLKNTLLGER